MGKAHTLGFLNVNRVFRLPVEVALRKLADVDAATAERGAKDLGFPSFTGDWRELVSDPSIDIVSVATPNVTHREMSLAAIAPFPAVPFPTPYLIVLLLKAGGAPTAGGPLLVWTTFRMFPLASKFS